MLSVSKAEMNIFREILSDPYIRMSQKDMVYLKHI